MATPLPLEGDGLVDNLFHFLWSKDDFNAGPRIFVPHTVVFKGAQPAAWYFTSLKTGQIKKKHKTNLTNLQIEHAFTKRSKLLGGGSSSSSSSSSSTDIVACYLYQVPGSPTDEEDDQDPSAPLAMTTLIEYLDAAALHDFLFVREKPFNGMLQRFVLPKGTHNATIRAIWSPKICLLERRVNTTSLYDPRFSVYERGVTFDGGGAGELFSRPEPVRGAMLPGEVQRLCEQLVDHVTRVSYHKFRISRMVLHLKTDADDRLWLLWCSSLRLLRVGGGGVATPLATRPLDLVADAHVPAHISLGHVNHPSAAGPRLRSSHSEPTLHKKAAVLDKDAPLRDGFQRCTSCASVVEQRRMLTTHYKAVLEHFSKFLLFLRLHVNEKEQVAIAWPPDARLIEAAGGVGFGILPFCDKAPSLALSSSSSSSSAPRLAGLNAKELIIPPVIQYLHPTLSVDDFERHRHDPIFLHKPVAVCESCCLVYSDYTTTALEANSLRPNVPAILRPQREVNDLKRRLDPLDPVSMAVVTSPGRHPAHSQSTAKLPASAWKPIPRHASDAGTSGGSGASATAALTKSTLHALPPAPRLPDRIDSLAAFIGSGDGNDNDGTVAVGRQREEAFFRELYHQEGVDVDDNGHPLHHMLESSDKLAQLSSAKKKQLAAIRRGVHALDSDDRSRGHLDWSALGKSASLNALETVLSRKTTTNPYTVVQKLSDVSRNGAKAKHKAGAVKATTSLSPSHSKGHGSNDSERYEWLRGSDGGEGRDDDDDHDAGAATTTGKQDSNNNTRSSHKSPVAPRRPYVSTREVQASEAHQAFLFAALQDAQQQLEQLGSLASLVLPVSCASTTAEAVSPASAYESDAEPREAASNDELQLQSVLSENASLASTLFPTDAFPVDDQE